MRDRRRAAAKSAREQTAHRIDAIDDSRNLIRIVNECDDDIEFGQVAWMI
jgi:hypothetical protein